MNVQSNITGSSDGATKVGMEGCVAAYDPLLDAITLYRRELATFNAEPNKEGFEEERAEATYSPLMRMLSAWTQPALTHAGAVAAVRIAYDECREQLEDDLITRMMAAGLAFFDAEEGGEMAPHVVSAPGPAATAESTMNGLGALCEAADRIEPQLNKISGVLRAMGAISERHSDDRDIEAVGYLIDVISSAVRDIDDLRMRIFIGLKAELQGRAN